MSATNVTLDEKLGGDNVCDRAGDGGRARPLDMGSHPGDDVVELL